jgi:hypothetical protein
MDGTGEHHLKKAKNCIFSLIWDFRSKTNAVILLGLGHTLRGGYKQNE